MGAHVWGPAFLRDHLLTRGPAVGLDARLVRRLPAYQFYMVVPSLLIVALDVGIFGGWLMIVPLAAAGARSTGAPASMDGGAGRRSRRAVLVVVFGVELPYGTAFKLVTVLGVLSPARVRVRLRAAGRLPFPGRRCSRWPALPFLFDRNFTIYGGNVASTLAGEFAFSISLSLALLYLGVVIRACAPGGTAPWRGAPRPHRALPPDPGVLRHRGTVVIVLCGGRRKRTFGGSRACRRWPGCSAFWVLPFWWQRDYVNDMGWEKLPYANAENDFRSLLRHAVHPRRRDLLEVPDPAHRRRDALPTCAGSSPSPCVGLVLSIAFRIAPASTPPGARCSWRWPSWASARDGSGTPALLPFYYLGLYLLAAIGVARWRARCRARRAAIPIGPGSVGPAVAAGVPRAGAFVLPSAYRCGRLPGGESATDGSYRWPARQRGRRAELRPLVGRVELHGLRGQGRLPRVPRPREDDGRRRQDHGCGRAFWEYEKEINRYGTPMALMLLPHWTDGCIGSMEGLFFEASATTPFHFLTQVELSAAPSAAQRDLPYGGFDIDAGVEHLQLMGVRYYLASSPRRPPRPAPTPTSPSWPASGPWVIFEVADSELVEPLENEPAVLDGHRQRPARLDLLVARRERQVRRSRHPPGTRTRTQGVFLAASGPDEWQRVDVDAPDLEVRPVAEAEVTSTSRSTTITSPSTSTGGHPGAREDVVLPQLEGRRRRRALPRGAEPHGGGPHRRARRAHLRSPADRVDRATPSRSLGIGLAVSCAARRCP